MINSKNKGSSYERALVKAIKNLFPDAATSRLMSKQTDDDGVDLVKTGRWAVQAKAMERTPKFHYILDRIPAKYGTPVCMWKKNNKGSVVTLKFEDWLEIASLLEDYKKDLTHKWLEAKAAGHDRKAEIINTKISKL